LGWRGRAEVGLDHSYEEDYLATYRLGGDQVGYMEEKHADDFFTLHLLGTRKASSKKLRAYVTYLSRRSCT